jgi:hypothetical protein
MPRASSRRRTIRLMKRKVKRLRIELYLRDAMDEHDSSADDEFITESDRYYRMKKQRYLFRSVNYRKDREGFDLEDALSPQSKKMNDEEFLTNFRMTRESFLLFLEEMKDKRAFVLKNKRCKQRPIAYQLLVFLYRIGSEGKAGGSARVASFFSIGKGSVNNYVRRTVSALHEIIHEVVYWPDEAERKEMRKRLSPFGFRHCVGIIDGSLVILDNRPEAYHECYYSRKSFYALNVMVVCDDNKRVIYYNAGWPGSTHDNRVFRNTNLYKNRQDYFSHKEYLLGDSAYSACPIMVQSFKKKAAQSNLSRNHEFFNKALAQVRISSEHCIGMLKGRFPCLKRNNIKLKKNVKEVKELVELIGACIVMHNLLIKYDESDIPSEWYDDFDLNIDWTGYDEEEEEIEQVRDVNSDRRKYVFNSLINNYLI